MQVTFDALQTISVTAGAVVLIAVANPPVIGIFLPLAYLLYQVRGHDTETIATPAPCSRHTSYLRLIPICACLYVMECNG